MSEATPKESYITKLLTLLIRRNNGEIRIPATDLMGDDVGQGFTVHFDTGSKELVLTYTHPGTRSYSIKENQAWNSASLPSNQPQVTQPLSQDQLLERVWTETAGTASVAESLRPRQQRRGPTVVLDDERQAGIEAERRKQSLLREVEDFQPETSWQEPRTTRSSQPSRQVTETYFKS